VFHRDVRVGRIVPIRDVAGLKTVRAITVMVGVVDTIISVGVVAVTRNGNVTNQVVICVWEE
jgi:hypothetical protein